MLGGFANRFDSTGERDAVSPRAYHLSAPTAVAALRASQPIAETTMQPIGVLGDDGRITLYQGH